MRSAITKKIAIAVAVTVVAELTDRILDRMGTTKKQTAVLRFFAKAVATSSTRVILAKALETIGDDEGSLTDSYPSS
jgi:carbohydrate-binding DOMON domain-containing protein